MTEKGSKQFGVVQIGQTALGIPIEHLSEVFHVDKEEVLPQASDYLRGGIALRGRLVPVLNLGRMGELKNTNQTPNFGVILEYEKKLLACFVDMIADITTVAEEDIHAISAGTDETTTLFGKMFAHQDQFVSVLNVPHVFALPDVYTAQRPNITQKELLRTRPPMLTFEAGNALYSVPAVEVYAAIPRQQIERTAITMGACLGEIKYHGRRIPVVCPVRTLGLGSQTPSITTEVVALRFPGDLVLGFAVDAIHEIGTFSKGRETPVPLWQAARNFIEKIIILDDDKQLYAISVAQLHVATDLQEIASLSEREPEPEVKAKPQVSDQQNVVHTKERYLVVDASERIAIPLAQVNCVVEPPDHLTDTFRKKPGFCGYFVRFEESIALFDLSACMGRSPADPNNAKILLTGAAGYQIGFMVDRVVGIEMSQWYELPPKGDARKATTLVQLGDGASATILPKMNLMDAIDMTAQEMA
ncbi:chemotaxis protein CheW [Yoonia sp. F2084L]|uniref:chemotaxis protein CheW n=1 Tax=Yoonia sp. F2084L TaxID=2926419 RepID=UPI001FF2BA76|nr:chemotaxis protein CheW [Yoonia sp. F2084L]MCK0094089.1 chemotaxis protein CheW [Yoonia sp. F2084L]